MTHILFIYSRSEIIIHTYNMTSMNIIEYDYLLKIFLYLHNIDKQCIAHKIFRIGKNYVI